MDEDSLLGTLSGGGLTAFDMVMRIARDRDRSDFPTRSRANGAPARHARAGNFEAAKVAIREGNLAMLTKLVQTPHQANWCASDRAWCLLDEAVKADSVEMVQWLLNKGADPNFLFISDRPFDRSAGLLQGMYFSPFASAIRGRNAQIVRAMLAHGADLSLPVMFSAPDDCMSCLDFAEGFGMLPCIEAFLLDQDTSTPKTDPEGPMRL